jgi:Tfp pilus assembly protein PilX
MTGLVRDAERDWVGRRGMALFIALGLILVIGIIVFATHRFARQQRHQSRHLSTAEVAFQAAEFGAQQGYFLVQRSVEFLNSTEPSTFPKVAKAPASLQPFMNAFVTSDGRLIAQGSETTLPVPLTPIQELLDSVGSHLSLTVVIRLEQQTPLMEGSPAPGLAALAGETRGRFVVDSRAVFQGVARRVVALFEHRSINLLPPVLGRFVMVVGQMEGSLNQVSIPLQGSHIIPRFGSTPSLRPMLVKGGISISPAERASLAANPGPYLDEAGWIFLGTPQGADPWSLTLGLNPGDGTYGEHAFLHGNRQFVYPIQRGEQAFGLEYTPSGGWEPFRMWETHQRYACLTGVYEATKTSARREFMRLETRDTQRSSLLLLMGSTAYPSPTLVFGKVFRRYLLEQGLRKKPDPPLPLDAPASATPCPFIPGSAFTGSWTGMSTYAADALRGTCGNTHTGYSQGMSRLMVTPHNEALAFFFDTTPESAVNRSVQPYFRLTDIPKLGRNIAYSPGSPDQLVLDGPIKLFRGGAEVYSGQIQQFLANTGTIFLTRCGRSFASSADLQRYLTDLRQKGRVATGFYHVRGSFSWTSEFNGLALGGVGIVCDDNLQIKSRVRPEPPATLVDAFDHPIILVSLKGNLIVETGDSIEAALIAPKGELRLSGGGALNLRGCLAVAKIHASTLATLAEKRLTYDPRFDWCDAAAYQNASRIMLEQQPMMFVAKPK